MARQPYLPVYEDRSYVVGALVMKDRDDLMAVIGKIIALWSHVDNETGTLFSLLMGTESDAALAVFLTLRRASNQREALTAAAQFKLNGEDLLIFNALMRVYGSLEAERNMLAHGCFGRCDEDPSLLYCIEIKHNVHFIVETLSREARGDFSKDRHARLKEHLYVYRKADLVKIYVDMESFWWAVFYFDGYLRNPADKGRLAEREKLKEYPMIKSALDTPAAGKGAR
jgi:hypothetical protein